MIPSTLEWVTAFNCLAQCVATRFNTHNPGRRLPFGEGGDYGVPETLRIHPVGVRGQDPDY